MLNNLNILIAIVIDEYLIATIYEYNLNNLIYI